MQRLGKITFALALLCAVAIILAAASVHQPKKWNADDYMEVDGKVVPDTFTKTTDFMRTYSKPQSLTDHCEKYANLTVQLPGYNDSQWSLLYNNCLRIGIERGGTFDSTHPYLP